MVKREVVGAHYGLRDWLAQRVTAIVMAIYTLLIAALLLTAPAVDYLYWRQLFAPQWMKSATLLFVLCVYLHAWIGMRNIVMDYIKNGAVRLALYILVIAALVVYTGWAVQILWSI
jgi:succinate dehydrogenase / fumarate reductase membrane anchor subunit